MNISALTTENAAHHRRTADANEDVMSPQFSVVWPMHAYAPLIYHLHPYGLTLTLKG